MKQIIRNMLCLAMVVFLSSCAHKTGHIKQVTSQGNGVTVRNGNNNVDGVETRRSTTTPITRVRSDVKLGGAEIFERYGSAVFMVYTSDGRNGFQGSGFFIDNNGLAVSNYHVFKGTAIGMEQIKLPNSNTVYNVKEVIHKSSNEDFILFRVNCKNTNYIPIAKSKPKIGERVYAIGSPKELENTISSGEISQWRDDNLIQTSVSIDHGSSGGALINEYGEVVGITSGTLDVSSSANLNYAWSIEAVKPYIKRSAGD